MRAIYLIFLFSVVFLIISYNIFIFLLIETIIFILFFLRSSRKLKRSEIAIADYPSVSIIIPMRNEEKNAIECIESLMSLDYPNFEILIGDDNSTDNTKELLKKAIKKNRNQNKPVIKLIDIPPIQDGWMGKAWASNYLIKEAKGDLILVTDADVRHSSKSLKHSISHFLKTKADIMIRFPYPVIKKIGEWPILFLIFILRFSSWFSFEFLKRRQSLAKEEYVIFSKYFYEGLGGYESFKSAYPMILPLLASAFKIGKNVAIVDDDKMEIKTRMYEGLIETFSGILGRINFRHFGFYSFMGAFTVVSFATDWMSRISLWLSSGDVSLLLGAAISYLMFGIFFGLYAFFSRQPILISLFAPILGIYFIFISLIAVFRLIINKPLYWKNRVFRIQ